MQKSVYAQSPRLEKKNIYAGTCIEKFWSDTQVTVKSGSGNKRN